MGIRNRKEYVKKITDFPIWKLINLCNVVENRIRGLKAQGVASKEKVIRNLNYKKSIVYNVLLDKLKLWKKGEITSEITYFDVQTRVSDEMLELV